MLKKKAFLLAFRQLGVIDEVIPDDVVVQIFRGDTMKMGDHAFETGMV